MYTADVFFSLGWIIQISDHNILCSRDGFITSNKLYSKCTAHKNVWEEIIKFFLQLWLFIGTPTKRQVSKCQVSKRPVSKRLKRQVYKTSGLQNVRITKRQVYKMSGLQNVRLQKKHPFIFCTCGWWKSAGSVVAMWAGKVMAEFYSLFLRFFCHISP